MKTATSISGGKTSAFIAANYSADYRIFSLVRTDDKNCAFPDKKLAQQVEDRLQMPFVGTLEDDTIVKTIFDLEQFIGQEITWVSGITFDEVIEKKRGWLPNKLHRYCTTHLKLVPIFDFWHSLNMSAIEMQIGFRANEQHRASRMIDKLNRNGLLEIKATIKKHPDGRNKWEVFEWQKPIFPLITDGVYKDQIESYWANKNVPFAPLNNCIGCFHRNEILLKKMSEIHPSKFDWFAKQEIGRDGRGTWRTGITYDEIKKHRLQIEIDFDDFSDCDAGYCGI